MVSKSQSKEAQPSKGQGKDIAVSKAQMGESKSVPSNPAKKMRFTSSSKKDPSSATFDESYICVLACTRGPLVDKKWTQLPKDPKEQIWEAVQMAYVVGEGGKKMVLLLPPKNGRILSLP
ncbi:unnamed protein product [Prunus brigantina]